VRAAVFLRADAAIPLADRQKHSLERASERVYAHITLVQNPTAQLCVDDTAL
jgi:alpha-glucosidase (family GH31 glycosyl hydrolase)